MKYTKRKDGRYVASITIGKTAERKTKEKVCVWQNDKRIRK